MVGLEGVFAPSNSKHERKVMMKSKLWVLAGALGLATASCMAPTTPTPAPAPMERAAPDVAGTPEGPTRHVLLTIPRGIPTTGRCYTLTTERVVFKVYKLTSDNRSDWNVQAQAVPNTCSEGSMLWDDKWYFYWLRPDIVDNLMLVWRNLDRREYGYVVIKNTPTTWLVYSSGGGPWVVKNNAMLRRTWHSDGKRIDIDVKNPNNTGGWGENDIWVSFGF
ncbi:MAG: hypothetical protein JWM80_6515 [Cyanobacteria bacterium RYN_339]|nr:hypothetical protein [Cyanobacteria bacterium RYN_339]